MDLVQHDAATGQALQEGLRIVHHTPYARKLAVELLDFFEALAKAGLPHPPDTGKPDDITLFPGIFHLTKPKRSGNHAQHCK